MLVEYFGQSLERNCNACDICFNDYEVYDNASEIAPKVLVAVKTLGETFNHYHIMNVLKGKVSDYILMHKHDNLQCFGCLHEYHINDIEAWFEQLVAQGYLLRDETSNIVKISAKGLRVLDKSVVPVLLSPLYGTRNNVSDNLPHDTVLFNLLRALRKTIAFRIHKRAYEIFSNRELNLIIAVKPTSMGTLRDITGLDQKKVMKYGDEFLDTIKEYCLQNKLELDVLHDSSAVFDL